MEHGISAESWRCPKIEVPPKSSYLGFSIINHPFLCTPINGNHHIYIYIDRYVLIIRTYYRRRYQELGWVGDTSISARKLNLTMPKSIFLPTRQMVTQMEIGVLSAWNVCFPSFNMYFGILLFFPSHLSCDYVRSEFFSSDVNILKEWGEWGWATKTWTLSCRH